MFGVYPGLTGRWSGGNRFSALAGPTKRTIPVLSSPSRDVRTLYNEDASATTLGDHQISGNTKHAEESCNIRHKAKQINTGCIIYDWQR